MNKQEAIEKIRSKKILEICISEYKYRIGYNDALNEAIYIIAQIDELESQAVPQLKEKLYTVEIPNPNHEERPILFKKRDGKVHIIFPSVPCWRTVKNAQLTEAEIKKDFAWAWEFAEEVEE